jgi:hypothetical protein
MYLKQNDEKKLLTYQNDIKKSDLNGYKYYHVLNKIQSSKNESNSKILSDKGVIKNNATKSRYYLEGKIYFHNLDFMELGLLLISLDVKELLNSKQYGDFVQENSHIIQNAYEQIGGAKPYGYGKVKVEVTHLYLEKNDCSFESLILNPFEEQKKKDKYVDSFIEKMCKAYGEKYLDYVKDYIRSKQEKDRTDKAEENFSKNNPTIVNWTNMNEKIEKGYDKAGGGYPKSWRLWTES